MANAKMAIDAFNPSLICVWMMLDRLIEFFCLCMEYDGINGKGSTGDSMSLGLSSVFFISPLSILSYLGTFR